MRLGNYTVSVLFILFIGCASPEVKIPQNVLTPEQMMPIMVDIHVIEGARNGAIMLGDTNGIEDYYAKVRSSRSSRLATGCCVIARLPTPIHTAGATKHRSFIGPRRSGLFPWKSKAC